MKKAFTTLLFVALFFVILFGCHNSQTRSKPIAISKGKSIDPKMEVDSNAEDVEPSFSEVLAETIDSYNKIENINKTVIDEGDTIQLHQTYYCLHDSLAIVPKQYLWGGDTTKDFVTHNFAAKIVVTNNKDTVLNKTFLRSDFNKILEEPLQKYSIIFWAEQPGYDKEKHEFGLGYSITIPLTDVGVPAFIVIDKKGHYRILDQYAKMDRFKD
jgi:hypothetical protein